jgi:hypothetical protein
VFLIIKILYRVILIPQAREKDLTNDDRSRNEFCVFKPSIVRSLPSYLLDSLAQATASAGVTSSWVGMTAHRDPQRITRDALPSCHLVIIPQACYGLPFNQ